MDYLKLSWLGAPIIEINHHPINMETRKAAALLAYLSLSSEALPRDMLAAFLWPEYDQTHAFGNLRRTLSSIQHSLGHGILVSTREKIGLNFEINFWRDTEEFFNLQKPVHKHNHLEISQCSECVDRLKKAAALYRGDFLAGMNLRDCPEFDNWQYLQREGFRSNYALLLERLTNIYQSLGEWESAISTARQWINLDFLNESAQRKLFQVLAMAGQRGAAIRQYDEYVRQLDEELAQQPDKETVDLINEIQKGEIVKVNPIPVKKEAHQGLPVHDEPLIRLKLFIPHPREKLVTRPQLLSKLDHCKTSALTLISAPAGYGKTTILSDWINSNFGDNETEKWSVCWLSLDESDNDSTRFLNYLIACLDPIHKRVRSASTPQKSSESLGSLKSLPQIVNELQEFHQSIILVLDDYQFINNPAIHDGVLFLLEHLPENVHLVISTRSDPPFSLARLRGRNQLNEIRAHDLRFSSEETDSFLKTVFDIDLTRAQIEKLENRTEGWIAGLQMAAISMQGRQDINQFIDLFSGSHRYIMDYLAEEVLNRQSCETQKFLLQTSIVDRLNHSLCDAILDDNVYDVDPNFSPSQPHQQESVDNKVGLQDLEYLNLFIIPLDDHRNWYRYHHLFSDLLRNRLEKVSPELVPILHSRASAWFETHGWFEEAIHHSLFAKDWGNAGRLIENHILAYLEDGQMATVIKWIESLPQVEILKNPKFCILVADIFSQAGRIDQIDPFLNTAEEFLTRLDRHPDFSSSIADAKINPKEWIVIRAMIPILRGLKSICSGDPIEALKYTETALNSVPNMDVKELAVLFWVQGWAYRGLGNLDRAFCILTRAKEYAIQSSSNLHDIWTDLAIVNWLIGRLPQAVDIFTDALNTVVSRSTKNQAILSRNEALISYIFLEQNHLELAYEYAQRAIMHTQWWPSNFVIATAYACLAQISIAQNNLDGALYAIQKAELTCKNRLMPPSVNTMIDVAMAKVWLFKGDWNLLEQWIYRVKDKFKYCIANNKMIDEYLETQLIMAVRVWIEKTKRDKIFERYEECVDWLTLLETNSRNAGRVNSLVEILVLKASILFTQGKVKKAFDYLAQSLPIAESSGYTRIFLDTGETARTMLNAYRRSEYSSHKVFISNLLQTFGPVCCSQETIKILPEALTPREMEILRLLAQGNNNHQIAKQLILAEGTIKFHVHHILEKLQVSNRTQAIICAKELGLI